LKSRLNGAYFAYSISQGVNLLAPLLIVPHLIKVLGLELIGVILLCQTIIIYLTVIVDYHFNLITVKELSLNRDKPSVINSIFIDALYTRIVLFTACVIIFLITIYSYPLLKAHLMIAILSFPILLGQVLINNWFFQGMEDLIRLSLLNILSKACYIISVYFFVNSSSDAIWPNFLLGIVNIAAGIFAIIYLSKKFTIQYSFPAFTKIVVQLKEGFTILLSNTAIIIYANSAIFILGFFVLPSILGEYGVTDKIISIGRAFLSIYFTVSFPRLSRLFAINKKAFLNFYKRYFLVFTVFIFIFCMSVFFMSEFIINYFTQGNSTSSLVKLLRTSSIIPIITCLNIPAYQTLILSNQKKIYTSVLISASVFSLVMLFFLVPKYQAFGAVYAIIITEIYVTITLWLFAIKKLKLIEDEAFV